MIVCEKVDCLECLRGQVRELRLQLASEYERGFEDGQEDVRNTCRICGQKFNGKVHVNCADTNGYDASASLLNQLAAQYDDKTK